ncbi:hypothetical protein [Psychrobacter sp. S4(2024)]|uniref:hypothetical protein n=1 Tax=Psychrobacter sp. S4(2024) TaxID=3111913 RepID=UPI002FDFBE8E
MSNDNKTNLKTTFKAGDSVLCPSLSNSPFMLTNDPYGKRNNLTLEFEGSYFYYDSNGYFVRASQNETDDFQPSLYQNTPANQQAINTLYSGIPTSQRTVIDTTEANDKEVILISAFDLRDIACDIESAAIVISDIGQLLGLIHYEKIDTHTAISMARLTHDATVTWYDLLQRQVNSIKETLAMTGYGKEGK